MSSDSYPPRNNAWLPKTPAQYYSTSPGPYTLELMYGEDCQFPLRSLLQHLDSEDAASYASQGSFSIVMDSSASHASSLTVDISNDILDDILDDSSLPPQAGDYVPQDPGMSPISDPQHAEGHAAAEGAEFLVAEIGAALAVLQDRVSANEQRGYLTEEYLADLTDRTQAVEDNQWCIATNRVANRQHEKMLNTLERAVWRHGQDNVEAFTVVKNIAKRNSKTIKDLEAEVEGLCENMRVLAVMSSAPKSEWRVVLAAATLVQATVRGHLTRQQLFDPNSKLVAYIFDGHGRAFSNLASNPFARIIGKHIAQLVKWQKKHLQDQR